MWSSSRDEEVTSLKVTQGSLMYSEHLPTLLVTSLWTEWKASGQDSPCLLMDPTFLALSSPTSRH